MHGPEIVGPLRPADCRSTVPGNSRDPARQLPATTYWSSLYKTHRAVDSRSGLSEGTAVHRPAPLELRILLSVNNLVVWSAMNIILSSEMHKSFGAWRNTTTGVKRNRVKTQQYTLQTRPSPLPEPVSMCHTLNGHVQVSTWYKQTNFIPH